MRAKQADPSSATAGIQGTNSGSMRGVSKMQKAEGRQEKLSGQTGDPSVCCNQMRTNSALDTVLGILGTMDESTVNTRQKCESL